MKFELKNTPKIKLEDLLRRRRLSLKQFLDEFGITTYEGLVNRCVRMGVSAPLENDVKKYFHISGSGEYPVPINNPQEGVVVVEPPPVVKETTGQIVSDSIEKEHSLEPIPVETVTLSETSQQKIVNNDQQSTSTFIVNNVVKPSTPTFEKLQASMLSKKLKKKDPQDPET